MAYIEHLAIRSEDPERLARYYETVFGWTRLRTGPGGGVHLTDGRINFAILMPNGQPVGIEHFGVKIDSLDEVKSKLTGYDTAIGGRPAARAAENRLSDPDGNQFDLSVKGFMGREG